jgi:hypothetical protein
MLAWTSKRALGLDKLEQSYTYRLGRCYFSPFKICHGAHLLCCGLRRLSFEYSLNEAMCKIVVALDRKFLGLVEQRIDSGFGGSGDRSSCRSRFS